MKAKVAIDQIRHNYATGWVYTDSLTEEQQRQLGVDITADYADLIEVEVDFTVGFHSGMVEVLGVSAFSDSGHVDVMDAVRIDELEMDIEQGYLC